MVGTGWLLPNPRDYTAEHPKVRKEVTELRQRAAKALQAPPAKVDQRPWCSPIENQLQLGSCTAHAAMGIVEYYERRAKGRHLDGSRLFVYKTIRDLLQVTGEYVLHNVAVDFWSLLKMEYVDTEQFYLTA